MDVFVTRYRLAWVLNKTGRHVEAEQQYAGLQRDLEIVVGELHPMTLIVRGRHAWTLASLDRFTDARAVYRSLRTDQERVLGARHQRVLATRLALRRGWRCRRAASAPSSRSSAPSSICTATPSATTIPAPWKRGAGSPTRCSRRVAPLPRSVASGRCSPTATASSDHATRTPC